MASKFIDGTTGYGPSVSEFVVRGRRTSDLNMEKIALDVGKFGNM